MIGHNLTIEFLGLPLALLRDTSLNIAINLAASDATMVRVSESLILADFIASALPMIAFIFLLGGTEGTILLTWQPK